VEGRGGIALLYSRVQRLSVPVDGINEIVYQITRMGREALEGYGNE
jgi:hypothetical protein